MRRIVIAVMGTVSALVLVFSFDASRRDDEAVAADHQASADSGTEDGGASASAGSPTGEGSQDSQKSADSQQSKTDGSTGSSSSGEQKGSGQGSTSGTFTGEAVQTKWGPVQVRIVVRNGKITKATAIQYPNENHHDVEINSWAIPQLEQATVDSNGQQIDGYSGATVTSDGYRQSLQSALDKAHL